MLKHTIYWNNICILSRHEESHLNEKIYNLREKYDIDLDVKYFGLGKEGKLSEKLKSDIEDDTIPNIIVSTDLEVFENNNIYRECECKLQEAQNIFNFRSEIKEIEVNRSQKLIPFLTIPLLIVVNKDIIKGEIPRTLEELIVSVKENKIVFGGINNSAGTSVVRGLWYKFGKDAVEEFREDAIIKEMPIQAFNEVKLGNYALALVPSVFAGIGKIQSNIEVIWPSDGALCIPSYIGVNNDVDIEKFKIIKEEIFTEEFCNFFVERGDIICWLEGTKCTKESIDNKFNLIYPEDKWLRDMNHEEFLNLYKSFKTC